MSTYNYKLDNFISTPTSDDKTIKIFNKYGVLKYNFNPSLSYFYYKNNFVYIKVENSDDITLDFETNTEAISALEKLNSAKKTIVAQATADIDYYTKTELNAGQLNNLYYTSGETDILLSDLNNLYSLSSHSHYVTGLTDVNISSLTNGNVLVYSNGKWINSAFTFDTSAFTSNYYTIEQLSSSTSGVDINWSNIIDTPTTLSEYGITDAYTKDELFTKDELTGGTLDSRYYTKINLYTNEEIDNIFYTSAQTNELFYTSAQTDILLSNKSDTGHTHYFSLSGLTDMNLTTLTNGEILVYLNGEWINSSTTNLNDYYTSAQTNELFYTSAQTDILLSNKSDTGHTHDEYSLTSHTHDEYSLTSHTHDEYSLTSHTHDEYSLTSHTHDDRYYVKSNTYSQSEVDDNFLSISTTIDELSGYTQEEINDNFLSANTIISDLNGYTQDEINDNFLSANTEIYTKNEAENSFLSANTSFDDRYLSANTSFYEQSEVDNLLDNYALSNNLTAHTSLTGSSNPHLISFFDLTNTSHTHDDRYYTKSNLDGGTLDSRYYTKNNTYSQTAINDNFLSANTSYYTQDELYTSAQTDILLESYYTKTETNNNFLSANTTLTDLGFNENNYLSANTSFYEQSEVDDNFLSANTSFYEQSEVNNLLNNLEINLSNDLTAHTSLTGSSNPHLISFFDLTNTSHTHDDRYWTKTELIGHTPAGSGGALDGRYYTKINSDGRYYTQEQIDALLSAITFSGTTGIYYTRTQTDDLLDGKSDTGHTHYLSGLTDVIITSPIDNNILVYSAATNSWYNTTLEDLSIDLSAYYTSAQTDDLLSLYTSIIDFNSHTGDTNNPHNTTFDNLTITSHTHLWSDISNTSHTHSEYSLNGHNHDSLYYRKTSLYTITDINNLLLNYYTSAQTDTLLDNYYTSAQTDIILDNYSLSSHSHYVSGLTDVTINAITNGEVLVYSGGQWLNSAITTDMSNYYTSSEVDSLITGLTFDTGATQLNELSDVTLSSIVQGQALIYNGSGQWVNSGISIDLSNYFTTAQTANNFISANTTLFSLSSHTHYLTGLTDIQSGITPLDGQFIQYDANISAWTFITSPGLSGSFLSLTGGTLTGDLAFSFMTGTTAQTNRVLQVTTGGTVEEGEELVSLYLEDSSLINYITSGNTGWTDRVFTDVGLSAYTLYEGQKYVDENYFYEYVDGNLYRTYYADKDHNHNDLYYTKSELTGGTLDWRYLRVSALSGFSLASLNDVDNNVVVSNDGDFLRYDSVSGWTNYVFDLTTISYVRETVLTGTTVSGVSGLTGGGTLDNNLEIAHLTADTSTGTVSRDPTAIVQNIEWDEYGHITTYETANFDTYWVRNISNANDVVTTGRQDKDYLYWDASTSKWAVARLNVDAISGLTEELDVFVKKTGESTQNIEGNIRLLNGSLEINNDLTINNGDILFDNSANTLSTSNNYFNFRNGRTTTPVADEKSGIVIDRYDLPNYYIVFDEGGSAEISGGSLKVGIENDLKTVLTVNSSIEGGIGFWDNNTFNTSEKLIWNSGSSLLELSGSIVPTNDGSYSLGSSSNQWKELYVSGGTIYLENIALTTDGTDLLWSGNTLGGGEPAGSNYEIQFNSGGSFGTSSNFTYDYINNNLLYSDSSEIVDSSFSSTFSSYDCSITGVTYSSIFNSENCSIKSPNNSNNLSIIASNDSTINANKSEFNAIIASNNSTLNINTSASLILGGTDNYNDSRMSIVCGENNKSYISHEFVIGRYNYTGDTGTYNSWVSTEQLFVVGNGTNDSNRNNAFTIYKNGNATLDGTLKINNSLNLGPNNVIENEDYSLAIFGSDNSIYSTSSIINGKLNSISGDTVSSSEYSSIIGSKESNVDNSEGSVIIGGTSIDITGSLYSIAGGGEGHDVIDSAYSVILGGGDNIISDSNNSGILGGSGIISGCSASAILGGSNNELTHNRSVILGGNGITSDADDTVYMPRAEFTLDGEGVIMSSPNGTKYKITVDNSGNLVSTPI